MAALQIYRFRSELRYFRPKIWRLFEVSGDITIATLCYIGLALYEAEGDHLFSMNLPKYRVRFDIPDENDELWNNHIQDSLNAHKYKLNKLGVPEGTQFDLSYDFGDSWEIRMTLKQIYEDPEVKKSELPRVLKGKGYGIVEDCGGVGGLADLVEAFKMKTGDRYEQLVEWFGREDFDIEEFDIDQMNVTLKSSISYFKSVYSRR
jgi:hypothetical protein